MVAARFPPGLIDQVQAWAEFQKIGKSEAIRKLVETGLKAVYERDEQKKSQKKALSSTSEA